MSLYPSLEDMQVGKMMAAQQNAFQQQQQQQQYQPAVIPSFTQNPYPEMPSATAPSANAVMYPDLGDYMGLELSQEVLAANMPEFVRADGTVAPQTNVVGLGELYYENQW